MAGEFKPTPYQSAAAENILKKFRDGRNTFVLADEAGLGKTYIAIQVIRDMFREKLKTNPNAAFNVYYICSNQRILEQNGKEIRENLERARCAVEQKKCDRLSMAFAQKSERGAVNLYTMSASLLDDSRSGGNAEERTLFRAAIGHPALYGLEEERERLKKHAPQLKKIEEERKADKDFEQKHGIRLPSTQNRWEFGEIRREFNVLSFEKNPPDLIILDEFHRMTMGTDETEGLKYLKTLADQHDGTKLLFLSATPYPFTRKDQEAAKNSREEETEGQTAFESFNAFVDFFAENTQAAAETQNAQTKHQEALQKLAEDPTEENYRAAQKAAKDLGEKLGTFMSRSERSRLARQAVPEEPAEPWNDIWQDRESLLRWSQDWTQGRPYLRRIPGVYSYAIFHNKENNAWSARYQDLKRERQGGSYLWKSENFELKELEEKDWAYHPQLRAIDRSTVAGREQQLWLPAIRPYWKGAGAYAPENTKNASKLLVFSGYKFIPRAVSSIFSTAVMQRNKAKAEEKQTPCIDWSKEPDELTTEYVKDLAEKVTLEDLREVGKKDLTAEGAVKYLAGQTGMEEADVWTAIGSPRVCLYRLIQEDIRIFDAYFAKEPVRWVLAAAGVKDRAGLDRYCANGNLQAVLEEYFFTLRGDKEKFCKALNRALTLKPSKVYILTEEVDAYKEQERKNAKAEQTGSKKELPFVECSFAERYTDDRADCNEHDSTWQEDAQDAFNSPFWPMVLTTTSVAQEGLNFHQYCRRIMHDTLPHTPMALEQREGRIDRYRGYLQRLRMANHHPYQDWASLLQANLEKTNGVMQEWKELFKQDEPGTNGVVPNWVVPREKEDDPRMERILGFLPGTEDAIAWDRLMAAKRQYRNIIGMPDDYALVSRLDAACQELKHSLDDLFPNLGFTDNKTP